MPTDPETDELVVRRFDEAMFDIYRRANKEVSYTASYFLQMLEEHGGLDTARRLLATTQPSEGFTKLWEHHRLDLTIEAHVVQPEFRGLFTRRELQTAERRLRDYGYEPHAQ